MLFNTLINIILPWLDIAPGQLKWVTACFDHHDGLINAARSILKPGKFLFPTLTLLLSSFLTHGILLCVQNVSYSVGRT